MALPRMVCTCGVARGIDVQDDARDLGPVGAISVRIKNAEIGDEVFHVVAGEPIYLRNLVSTVRIERWPRFDHGGDILRACGTQRSAGMRRNDGGSEHIGDGVGCGTKGRGWCWPTSMASFQTASGSFCRNLAMCEQFCTDSAETKFADVRDVGASTDC